MSPSKNTTSLVGRKTHNFDKESGIWHFWSVSGGILVVRKEDSVENNFNKGMLNVKNLTFQPRHNYYNQGDVIYVGIFTENSSLESTSLE